MRASIICHGWPVIALFWLTGCSSGLFSHIPVWSPFKTVEKTTYETPVKRIAKLQALAADADRTPPAEQQRISAELAQQMRNEQDPIIREQILRTIANFSTPTSSEVLSAGLQDPDSQVRIVAIDQIAARGGPEAATVIGAALRGDSDPDVRLAATRALGETRGPAATTALAVALESSDPALQYRAMQSLKSSTGEDFGDDVSAWRQYASGGPPPAAKPFSVADQLKKLQPF